MFQLTTEETQYWKSQIVTSNAIKMGLRRHPYAFTELGVAMLSSVLNSKIAIQINTKRHQRRNCHAIGINQPILGRITDEKEKIDSTIASSNYEQYKEDALATENELSENSKSFVLSVLK